MFIRVFRVSVHSNLLDEFQAKFADISVRHVRAAAGLVSVSIGKPTRWHPDEFVMVSRWKSEEALIAFAGQEWNKPVIPPGMDKYVRECWVHHYEVYGEGPDEVGAEGGQNG
jgi:quinol monooxygenase YgiN